MESSERAQETGNDKDKKIKKNRLSTNSIGSMNEGSALEVAAIEEAALVVNAVAAERNRGKDKEKKNKRPVSEEAQLRVCPLIAIPMPYDDNVIFYISVLHH